MLVVLGSKIANGNLDGVLHVSVNPHNDNFEILSNKDFCEVKTSIIYQKICNKVSITINIYIYSFLCH